MPAAVMNRGALTSTANDGESPAPPPAAATSSEPRRHTYVFDLKADQDVYWCAADIGWVTGHSYIVYDPALPFMSSDHCCKGLDFDKKESFIEHSTQKTFQSDSLHNNMITFF